MLARPDRIQRLPPHSLCKRVSTRPVYDLDGPRTKTHMLIGLLSPNASLTIHRLARKSRPAIGPRASRLDASDAAKQAMSRRDGKADVARWMCVVPSRRTLPGTKTGVTNVPRWRRESSGQHAAIHPPYTRRRSSSPLYLDESLEKTSHEPRLLLVHLNARVAKGA